MLFLFKLRRLLILLLLLGVYCQKELDLVPESVPIISRPPKIEPDYAEVALPPNIAPLNFKILEAGENYLVRIHANQGRAVELVQSQPEIQIPLSAWKKLLLANLGGELYVDIYVQDNTENWQRFQRITNHIAREEIDSYLTYRLLFPGFIKWKEIGIYQRNLENFEVSEVVHNRFLKNGCVNCHTFHPNGSDMLIHLRAGPGTGMLLKQGHQVRKINTKTAYNGHTAYAAWHPAGRCIAFAAINVHQFFHASGENREVFDTASDLVLYQIDSNMMTSSAKISTPEWMETWPAWSADGNYLYFCRTPQFDENRHFSEQYQQIKYDLCRIEYHLASNTWGEVETVISAEETGLSVAHPKISPDGRFLVFCLSAYGNFTIYHPDSDLYLLDLQSGEYHKMSVNSDRCESYHSWSANSRWLVFSSKRDDGLWARPYLAYITENGVAAKPFVLPQQDPTFYENFLRTFNLPELTSSPINIPTSAFIEAALQPDRIIPATLDPQLQPRQKQSESEMPWLPVDNK